MIAPTPADVRAAAARINGLVHRTPVLTSRSLNACVGVSAFFKCENFQRGGSFKLRGATNFVRSLDAAELERGVVAFSSGNHAQAVAIAARAARTSAVVVMPEDAPKSKVDATALNGARIVRYNRFTQDRETIAAAVAAETGSATIPPYDHPLTIAGQGTAAMELIEDIENLDAIVAPVGGGGLASGTALIAHELKPGIQVFGAEPELANDTWRSFQEGERVTIPSPDTIADGLRSPSPGAITFPILRAHLEDILLVREDEIRVAMRFLLTHMKIVVEPSGAVPVAAVLFGKLPPDIKRVGVIISGGNVDLSFLATL